MRPGENETTSQEIAHLREINSRLVMLLGHELGSPLTVILAYLRLWQDRATSIDREELDLVVGQALALKARLSDLVLLDQLESGLGHLALEPQDVDALVRAAIEKASNGFKERNLTFITGITFTDPLVADRDMVLRALDHLITNACKFSPFGSTIHLLVERKGTNCRIGVIDHGIGIAPELHALIFEPFYQADLTRARRYGGMGIGLKLVRAIVERHYGCVTVASSVGAGSTFTLVLPLTPPEVPAA